MNGGTKHGQMKALGVEACLQMGLDLLRQRALKNGRWMGSDEVRKWYIEYASNQPRLEHQSERSRSSQVSKLQLFADLGCLWGNDGVVWVETLLALEPRISQTTLHKRIREKRDEALRKRHQEYEAWLKEDVKS